MNTFTKQVELNLVSIADTPYIVLAGDINFIQQATLKKTIVLEESIKNLPEVQALRPGDVVVDCGAFIGDTALIFAEKGCIVHAFEPQYDAFVCLDYNTEAYYGKVHNYNVALGDHEGSVIANNNPLNGNPGTRTAGLDQEGHEVKMITLDSLGLKRMDFGKYDCESGELDALLGSVNTIKRCKPKHILVEIYPEMLDKKLVEPRDIDLLMEELGYEGTVCIGNTSEPRWDVMYTRKP